MNSLTAPRFKSKRLNADDRQRVRDAFTVPVRAKIEADAEVVSDGIAAEMHKVMFTAEEHCALKVLQKGGYARMSDQVNVSSVELNANGYPQDNSYVHFHCKYPFANITPQVPLAMIKRYDAEVAKREANRNAVLPILAELNSVLTVAKTRYQIGQLWPAAYDLMGKDWIEASDAPNTLPALTTVGLDAAMMAFKKAA